MLRMGELSHDCDTRGDALVHDPSLAVAHVLKQSGCSGVSGYACLPRTRPSAGAQLYRSTTPLLQHHVRQRGSGQEPLGVGLSRSILFWLLLFVLWNCAVLSTILTWHSQQVHKASAAELYARNDRVHRSPPRQQQHHLVMNLLAADTRADILEREPLATVNGLTGRTLVMYMYVDVDQHSEGNLRFFLQWGLGADERVDYTIVIDARANLTEELPPLPPGASYRPYKGRCRTVWGRWGWLLMSVEKRLYDYFIFMDSSVRGPLLPSYVRSTLHWTQLYTGKVNDRVKLVGSYISCENDGLPRNGPDGRPLQFHPYVRGGVFATDKVGLKLVEKDRGVLMCDHEGWQELYYSEMGISAAVLRAGYNLDSFMLRYRDVDWADTATWECNDRLDPVGEHKYDGASLNPLELVFVPMNAITVGNEWSYAKLAATYEAWMALQAQGALDVSSNLWSANPWRTRHLKKLQEAYVRERGFACFDQKYYLQNNPDLKILTGDNELWEHFVRDGQFETRPIRWNC